MKIIKKNIIMVIICIIIVVLLISCDKSTDPVIQKDPRTYTWTIDTIEFNQSALTMMQKIWGSSSSDMYVVGHNDPSLANIYHYGKDKNWEVVKINESSGGIIKGAFDLSDIYGFSWNNIWAVGSRITYPSSPPYISYSSFIIHYDGVLWGEMILDDGKVDNNNLLSVWGNSPYNVFCCGKGKYVWQYNGFDWINDSIPVFPAPDYVLSLKSITGDRNWNVYLSAESKNNNGHQIYYFLEYKKSKWSIIDSFVIDNKNFEYKWGMEGFWMSPEGTLYSYGPVIYKWQDSKWKKFFTIDLQEYFLTMGGTSDKNIFLAGAHGKVFHYDGVDWYQYEQFKNPAVEFRSIWTDGNEVFITGYFYSMTKKTIILHGK